jgi:hypothetical protein
MVSIRFPVLRGLLRGQSQITDIQRSFRFLPLLRYELLRPVMLLHPSSPSAPDLFLKLDPGTGAPHVSRLLRGPCPVSQPPSDSACRSFSGPGPPPTPFHPSTFLFPCPSTPRHAPASRSGRAPFPADPSTRTDPCRHRKHSFHHPHAPSRGRPHQPPRTAKALQPTINTFPVNRRQCLLFGTPKHVNLRGLVQLTRFRIGQWWFTVEKYQPP